MELEPPPQPCETAASTPFLRKIPVEIRLQIYTELIKSWGLPRKVHLVFTQALQQGRYSIPQSEGLKRNLTFVPCMSIKKPNRRRSAFAIFLPGYSSGLRHCWLDHLYTKSSVPSSTTWPLLTICRQIYTEVIELLYSSFDFDFVDIHTAHHFLTRVPQPRLQHIQSIGIEAGTIPHTYLLPPIPLTREDEIEEAQWLKVCSVLCQLEGLRELNIILINDTGEEADEESLFAPIRYNTHCLRTSFLVHTSPLPLGQRPRPRIIPATPAEIQIPDLPEEPVASLPLPTEAPLLIKESMTVKVKRVALKAWRYPSEFYNRHSHRRN